MLFFFSFFTDRRSVGMWEVQITCTGGMKSYLTFGSRTVMKNEFLVSSFGCLLNILSLSLSLSLSQNDFSVRLRLYFFQLRPGPVCLFWLFDICLTCLSVCRSFCVGGGDFTVCLRLYFFQLRLGPVSLFWRLGIFLHPPSLSQRQVALPVLKNPVYSTIYPRTEQSDSCLSEGH